MNRYKIFILIAAGLLFTSKVLAQEYTLAAETLYSFGQAFIKQERYPEAKQELQKCLMLNAQHKQAKKLLELCDQRLARKREEAIEKTLTPLKQKSPWGLKQGTWYLEKSEFYGELYTKYYWNNHKFDDNGKKKRWDYDGKGDEITTELKLEYGLTDKYTLMLYTVAKEAHWKDSFKSCTTRGFTEMWPGVKYLLSEKPFISYLRLRTKFPFDYSEEAVPALGKHQIDGEVKICTAQPWPKLPGYTKFELGFKARNEEPANEIIYFSQLAYNLTDNLIMELSLDGQEGLASTGGVDEDWLKYTVGPILKFGLLNIKFGYGNTFAGKNTSAADEVYLSVYTWW